MQNPLAVLASYVASHVWPTEARKPAHAFLARLHETKRHTSATAAQVVGLAAGSAMSFAQAAAQIVDFYMDDARAKERAALVQLAQVESPDAEQEALFLGYVREALRECQPPACSSPRTDGFLCRPAPAGCVGAPARNPSGND